ncbi:ACT domain-containing protein [Cellulosilyticum sp. I15G10I2]|uniref:ACT domain-containing protein n=1 Tax=Cellulosilyticum sp. I15G10I2 TaxID=1892843 RepID=UPI00085C5E94|nr:ACT domain-containing protein [Cellulosilyticum sp. I15G10I2]
MKDYTLNLEVLEGVYCICKGLPDYIINELQFKSDFFSLTKTSDEVSVVCNQQVIATDTIKSIEKDWKILKVSGVLDFSLIGILAKISRILAQVSVSIFVLSTYDTDYILVKASKLVIAAQALEQSGHSVKFL